MKLSVSNLFEDIICNSSELCFEQLQVNMHALGAYKSYIDNLTSLNCYRKAMIEIASDIINIGDGSFSDK